MKISKILPLVLLLTIPQLASAYPLDSVVNGIVGGIAGTIDNLIAAAFSIVAAFFLTVACATALFVVFYADMLVGIGLALGPLILALGVMQYFKSLVSSWVEFLMGAMFTKVIIALIASMILPVLRDLKVAGQSSTDTSGAFGNTAAMIAIILMSFILYQIIKEAPNITSTLFGGVGGSHNGMGMAQTTGKTASQVGGAARGAAAGAAAAKEAGGKDGGKASFGQIMSGVATGGRAGAAANGRSAREAGSRAAANKFKGNKDMPRKTENKSPSP